MHTIVALPVASEPQDSGVQGLGRLRSIAESKVLLQTLRQSRSLWLNTLLPKFSSKRPKDSTPHRPAHQAHFVGKCDIHIGPIIFGSVAVFDVRYNPSPSTLSYPAGSLLHTTSQAIASPMVSAGLGITPVILSQVTQTSLSDPYLAALLQLAAIDKASPEQLRTLGARIQSIAASFEETTASDAAASSSIPVPQVIVEFTENPHDRWLLPRESLLMLNPIKTTEPHLSLYLKLPLPAPSNASNPHHGDISLAQPGPAQPIHVENYTVVMHMHKVPDTLIKFFQARFTHTTEAPNVDDIEKLYLQYRLEDGPLANQLQSINTTRPSTKLLRPTISSSRRQAVKSNTPSGSTLTKNAASRFSSSLSSSSTTFTLRCKGCGETGIPLVTSASETIPNYLAYRLLINSIQCFAALVPTVKKLSNRLRTLVKTRITRQFRLLKITQPGQIE